MDGLIINEPYASMVIDGKKKWELRSRRPPENKVGSNIYLLSKGSMLGIIKIKNFLGPMGARELKKYYFLHRSDVGNLTDNFVSYVWEVKVCEKFKQRKKYAHPMGARVWVKDVTSLENHNKSKIVSHF